MTVKFIQRQLERKIIACSNEYPQSRFKGKRKRTRLLGRSREKVRLKPVSHQPCGSRAPVHVDKFLDFVRQPHCVVYYTARLPYEKQGRKAAAKNFRHVHFLCDLLAFSERCTAAARHTRLPQDCCKTRKVFVRLT